MVRLLAALAPGLLLAFRSRRGLLLDNLALRQQLACLASSRRPVIRLVDRAVWIVLSRLGRVDQRSRHRSAGNGHPLAPPAGNRLLDASFDTQADAWEAGVREARHLNALRGT